MKKIRLFLIVMLCAVLCSTACLSNENVQTKTEAREKTEKKEKKSKKEKKKEKKSKKKKSKAKGETKEKKPDNESSSDKDELLGTTWTCTDDDSYWVFNDDHSFYWYQDREDTDDNYYGGTYTLYKGWEALKLLDTELSSYCVTSMEILGVIDRSDDYKVEDFVVLYTDYSTFMLDGKEQLSESTGNSYYGFLQANGEGLGIINMETGNLYTFIKNIDSL